MQITLHLSPDIISLVGLLSPSRAALQILQTAIDSVPPGSTGSAPADGVPIRVYVPPTLYAALIAHGASVDGLALYASGLIAQWASIERSRQRAEHHIDGSTPDGDPLELRLNAQQRSLRNACKAPLQQGKVVFAEASTGVGKSWVIALAVRDGVAQGKRITIAAPTLNVMAELIAAFEVLALPLPTPLLGRGQFIDPSRLRLAIADAADDVPAAEWAALAAWNGAPLHVGVVAPIGRAGAALAWLAEDAMQIAPSLPLAAVRYASNEDIPAQSATKAAALTSQVIITTHAMLAVDLRLRSVGRALLPETDWLIVDEAHLLEDAIAQAFSDQMSVYSLQLQLRAAKERFRDVLQQKRMMPAIDRLLAHGAHWRDVFADVPTSHFMFFAGADEGKPEATLVLKRLRDAASIMLPDLDRLAASAIPELDLESVIAALRAITDRTGHIALELSPVRRYPSLVVGQLGIRKRAAQLWARVEAAMLVSATLYIQTPEIGNSAGYVANLLGVPTARAAEISPVVAPWVHSTPTVYLPSLERASLLCPPGRSDDAADPVLSVAERAYYDAIAQIVITAADSAAGGTLVLCTSYRAIGALTDRVGAAVSGRLLVQRHGLSVSAMAAAFRSVHAAGIRPVWLATGAAWTGLNLRDQVAPIRDSLLTDLVVTRLPVTQSTGVFGRSKTGRGDLRILRLKTAFTFRQGIGRLIRADGLTHRRLWLCDGRLVLPVPAYVFLTQPCRQVIAAYPHQVRI